jgi:geranylgeranyl pyrophosphate synthase
VSTSSTTQIDGLIQSVREVACERLRDVGRRLGCAVKVDALAPGKMLRTRLAARILPVVPHPVAPATVEAVCAAVEVVHAATLCHDDVIDNASTRRAVPTLWRETSSPAAVLIGDILLCESMQLIVEAQDGRYVGTFLDKVSEVCAAEAWQELSSRGRVIDEDTCLRVARGKTGPLFAMPALVCGGDDDVLSAALEEVGYRVGAAYQLADDLIDVIGDEDTAGKTLRTDRKRGKFTLAQRSDHGRDRIAGHIERLCGAALECVVAWPGVHGGLHRFFALDLQAALRRFDVGIKICTEPADEA